MIDRDCQGRPDSAIPKARRVSSCGISSVAHLLRERRHAEELARSGHDDLEGARFAHDSDAAGGPEEHAGTRPADFLPSAEDDDLLVHTDAPDAGWRSGGR